MAKVRIPVHPGDVYGRLTVIRRAPRRDRRLFFLCRCECGNEVKVYKASLYRGLTRSCGCLRTKTRRKTDLRLYSLWGSMVTRCHWPGATGYEHYGGRGIAVCERWRTFDNFIADVPPRPSFAHTLDRIDNSRGYEPGNVRWATHAEQNRNTRRNRLFTHDGVTLTVTDWAARRGLNIRVVFNRLKRGWTVERALSPIPSRHHQSS